MNQKTIAQILAGIAAALGFVAISGVFGPKWGTVLQGAAMALGAAATAIAANTSAGHYDGASTPQPVQSNIVPLTFGPTTTNSAIGMPSTIPTIISASPNNPTPKGNTN